MAPVSAGTELRIAMAVRDVRGRPVARRLGIHESKLSRILRDKVPTDPVLLARIREAIAAEAAAAELLVERTTVNSGVPYRVQDPATLAKVAALVTSGNPPPS